MDIHKFKIKHFLRSFENFSAIGISVEDPISLKSCAILSYDFFSQAITEKDLLVLNQTKQKVHPSLVNHNIM